MQQYRMHAAYCPVCQHQRIVRLKADAVVYRPNHGVHAGQPMVICERCAMHLLTHVLVETGLLDDPSLPAPDVRVGGATPPTAQSSAG